MDLDVLVKQVDDIAQLFLGVDVVDPDGLEGDEVYDRGELILDSVIQLVQNGSSLGRAHRLLKRARGSPD